MQAIYLRLLHAYATVKGCVQLEGLDVVANKKSLLLDGRLWYNLDELIGNADVQDSTYLSAFARIVESRGAASDIYQQAIAFCTIEGHSIDTDVAEINCTIDRVAQIACLTFTARDGKYTYVFYDMEHASVYTLSTEQGVRYSTTYEILKDYIDDIDFKDFCIKLKALPALLPDNSDYKSKVYYRPKSDRIVVQDRGSELQVPANLTGIVSLCGDNPDAVYNEVRVMQVIAVAKEALDMCRAIIDKCTEAHAKSDKSNITYHNRNGFKSCTFRRGVTTRTLAVATNSDYVVLSGMQWSQVPSLAKQLDMSIYASSAITSYMSAHKIKDQVAEMLRLLDLAGIKDAEERILSVLKDLGEIEE